MGCQLNGEHDVGSYVHTFWNLLFGFKPEQLLRDHGLGPMGRNDYWNNGHRFLPSFDGQRSTFYSRLQFRLAIISMISSFTIMCICSGSLDTMHRYPDACSDYVIIPPGEYYFEETNNTIAIPPCGDYSETRQSFNALLLICSLVSIPTHSLLILGVINAFNPVSVSPN